MGKIGLRVCGKYNAEMPYEKLDVVAQGGSSYVAKEMVTGVPVTDTSKWTLLCSGCDVPDYLTEEVATGKYWVDGKMIYSKMYVKENAAKGTTYSIPVDVEYETAWIDPTATVCVNASGNSYPAGYANASGARALVVYFSRTNNNIRVLSEVVSTGSFYIRLLYTKPE